jgi:hypothetical protein
MKDTLDHEKEEMLVSAVLVVIKLTDLSTDRNATLPLK